MIETVSVRGGWRLYKDVSLLLCAFSAKLTWTTWQASVIVDRVGERQSCDRQ